jgi:hypothetical protein
MNLFFLKKNNYKKGFTQVVDFGFVFENISKNLRGLVGKFMSGGVLKSHKTKTFSKPKFTTGFTIAETLVYVAIMTVVLIVIVNIVLVVSKSINKTSAYNNIKDSAIFGLEKMTKEVKFSTDIDFGQSVFNSPNGVLVLNSKDASSTPKVIKFYLDNGLVKIDIDGTYFGPATYSDTNISKLIFVPIDTGNSKAIKIEMSLDAKSGEDVVSEDFYSTIVLRNSY